MVAKGSFPGAPAQFVLAESSIGQRGATEVQSGKAFVSKHIYSFMHYKLVGAQLKVVPVGGSELVEGLVLMGQEEGSGYCLALEAGEDDATDSFGEALGVKVFEEAQALGGQAVVLAGEAMETVVGVEGVEGAGDFDFEGAFGGFAQGAAEALVVGGLPLLAGEGQVEEMSMELAGERGGGGGEVGRA